jgi:catechol 2,3-dioxygenase-like lactoylglutathione lyase family enzyme
VEEANEGSRPTRQATRDASSMIDHVGLKVSDFPRSVAFYDRALAPVGYARVFINQQERYAGYAGPSGERIWIAQGTPPPEASVHLAILAADRATVRRFHEAALAAGGRDHGAPGPRPQYSPTYYGAFVLDPDGYNLEAVCFKEGE